MKRDFSAVVRDFDGKPHVRNIMKYDAKTGMPVMVVRNGQQVHDFDRHEAMTLRTYVMDALGGRWMPADLNIERSVLTHRGQLYNKLCFATDPTCIELEARDFPVILDALYAKGDSTLVYTSVETMLGTDPKPAEAAPE